jgi:hypothetical protein
MLQPARGLEGRSDVQEHRDRVTTMKLASMSDVGKLKKTFVVRHAS